MVHWVWEVRKLQASGLTPRLSFMLPVMDGRDGSVWLRGWEESREAVNLEVSGRPAEKCKVDPYIQT